MIAKTEDKYFDNTFKRKSYQSEKNDSFKKIENFKSLFPKRFKQKKEILKVKYYPSINFFFLGFILFLMPKAILSLDYYIDLKVKATGYNQILSNEYTGDFPSVIYINNEVHVLRGREIFVENITYPIRLQWSRQLSNFKHMFSNLESIISVHINHAFGNNCDLSYMLSNCINLKNFTYDTYCDSSHLITDTIGMFYNCISLTSFSFYNLYMYYYYNSYRNMSYMFYNCQMLNSIYYDRYYIRYIVDMRWMFYNCKSLISINLTSFLTTSNKYANSSYMFYNCISLEDFFFTSQDSNYFYTNDMQSMFYNCGSLTNINLKQIRILNSINVSRLFYNCNKLSQISGNFNNFLISDAREMFYNCNDLKFQEIDDNNNNYIIIYLYNYNSIPVNMSNMFYNCRNLESVSLYSNWNNYLLPNDFHSMFYNCISLTSVYFKYFNLNYIQNTSYMFYNCINLKEFKRDNFNCRYPDIIIEKNSMKGMFQNCESLVSLDLSYNFCTKNVELMWDMFKGCKSLEYLNVRDFDTSKVTDMESMFEGCSSLISLDLTSFKATIVQYMNKMFYNCEKLQELLFPNILSNSIGTMYQMFYNCKDLQYLNLFSLTEKGQSISEMFQGASTTFTLCIEENENIPKIFEMIKHQPGISRNCHSSCYGYERRSIETKKLCCQHVEFNGFCYDKCPSRTKIKAVYKKCENFTCDLYYNYEQDGCIDTIPLGYYENDTTLKTIDKCHDDCQNCSKVGIDANFTCESCKGGKPYIYLGNCYDRCLKGEIYRRVCKCFDERCLTCTEPSIRKGLCTQCNDGYYRKVEDKNKPEFECFKTLEKYYLGKINKYDSQSYFFKCYSSCQTCDREGNNLFHNCLTCNNDNIFALRKNGYYNCYPNCTYNFYFNESNRYTCTVNSSCPRDYPLFVPDTGQCVKSCLHDTDNQYQYEFKQQCFSSCPVDSHLSDIDRKICTLSCPFERPFCLHMFCVSNCTINERRDKDCFTNYFGNRSNFEIQDKILLDIEDHLLSNKYNFSVIKEQSIVIEENKTNYELTTTDKKENNRITSSVDLSECEEALRGFYGIPDEDSIYLLKYDIYMEGKQGPTVRYKLYSTLENPNMLEPLDLTVCENLPIVISVPANITGNPDLYNKNSPFYTDICAHYDIDGAADMTLEDRQKDYIDNNKSLCEEDCNFNGYDQATGKVDCACGIKVNQPLVSEIKIDKDKLYDFMDIKKIANFDVLRCYNLIISKVHIVKNIGFYLFIPTFISFVISAIFFGVKEFKKLKIQINDIVFAKQLEKYFNRKIIEEIKPKFIQPIFIQVDQKKKGDEEARKKMTSKIKKTKISMISNRTNRMKTTDQSNISNLKEKESDKKETIEKNNINNEIIKKSESIQKKKEVWNKGNEIPKNVNKKNIKNKKIDAPPIKKQFTEGNIKDNDFPSSKRNINLNLNKKSLQLTTYKNNKDDYYSIYPITQQKIERAKAILAYNDNELNNLDFKDAIKHDTRGYWQYYFSLLKTKHIIIITMNKRDYNILTIKIFLIFFNFSLGYAVNGLFFNDDTMHKILEDEGKFNLIYQLPQIIYSTVISMILENLLNFLALSEEHVILLKQEKVIKNIKKKGDELIKKLQMRFIGFYIIGFLVIIGLWYYIASFCAVYNKTQYHLIKDTLISTGTSFLTPIGINLLPGIMRIPALKARKEIFYNLSKILQIF